MVNKTKEITEIGIAISALIVGGYTIFIVSGGLAIPGFKYLLMAPYLSLVMTVIIQRINSRYLIVKFNLVFAMIMGTINIFMALAIILTGLSTELTVSFIGKDLKTKSIICGTIYSGYVVLSALIVSKWLIGGAAFEGISNAWILILFLIACVLGFIGSRFGNFICTRLGGVNE